MAEPEGLVHNDDWLTVIGGDCRRALAGLPEAFVSAVITSPPYYGLRDYDLEPLVWGGDPEHDHAFALEGYTGHRGTRAQVPQTKHPANRQYPEAHRGPTGSLLRSGRGTGETGSTLEGHAVRGGPAQQQGATSQRRGRSNTDAQSMRGTSLGGFCECGAWQGQLGMEPRPEMYVEHLVEVMRAVRRVLHPTGTVWLNLGDSFWSTGGAGGTMSASGLVRGAKGQVLRPEAKNPGMSGRWNRKSEWGLKEKDQILIPARVAIALQADGWWLRQTVVWVKDNAMPESVDDRPTSAHEYVFMLTPREHYYYDWWAVQEPLAFPGAVGVPFGGTKLAGGQRRTYSGNHYDATAQNGRRLRSVWRINTRPYPGAHYAVFPDRLVEPPLLASTSAKGVCPVCWGPWERELIRVKERTDTGAATGIWPGSDAGGTREPDPTERGGNVLSRVRWEATGNWLPPCDHEAGATPAWVLDPFAGTGTVGIVAQRHNRRAVLIDQSTEYLKQQLARNADIPMGIG